MATKSQVYLDSCCFIDMAKEAVGQKLTSQREQDVWHLKQLLQAARDGEIVAYTSVLTIAECTHADGNLSDGVQSIFTRLLTSGQYTVLIQPTPFIAIEARDLRWQHGINVRGADAVHVASALDRSCEEFLTTDGRIKKLQPSAALAKRGLRIIHASETECLPAKYLQHSFLDK